MSTTQLIEDCLDSINLQIEAFDKELLQLKNKLHDTQKTIKAFYQNEFDARQGEEIKQSLLENKHIITQLKKEAEAYAHFEKLNLYLTKRTENNLEDVKIIVQELIIYFEKKEAYEQCALFQKLNTNLQNKA